MAFFVCKDLTGQKFNRLLVLSRTENAPDGHSRWVCRCDCGNTITIQSNNLRLAIGCGCVAKERAGKLNLIHGRTKTKEFKAWDSMLQRCYNPKNASFKRYGGRGITVCPEWRQSFETFYKDLGVAPSRIYSVDRINNNGNYEAKNCRWATPKEQRNNQN